MLLNEVCNYYVKFTETNKNIIEIDDKITHIVISTDKKLHTSLLKLITKLHTYLLIIINLDLSQLFCLILVIGLNFKFNTGERMFNKIIYEALDKMIEDGYESEIGYPLTLIIRNKNENNRIKITMDEIGIDTITINMDGVQRYFSISDDEFNEWIDSSEANSLNEFNNSCLNNAKIKFVKRSYD